MLRDLKSVLVKSDTLLQDSAGAAALILMLFAGLHLSAFI